MPVRIQVIFYSMYGHIYKMAEAVAEGARTVDGAEVELLQIQETMSQEVLAKMGAVEAKIQTVEGSTSRCGGRSE